MCDCNIAVAYIYDGQPHSKPINKSDKANGRKPHRQCGVGPYKGAA